MWIVGLASAGLAYATYRIAQREPRVGDEARVSPNALTIPGVNALTGPIPPTAHFVSLKISRIVAPGSAGTIEGYLVGAEGAPAINPPLGPVQVPASAILTLVRNGQVVS